MFKSVGHFFATFFSGVLKVADDAAKAAPVIEAVTTEIPVYGPLAQAEAMLSDTGVKKV